jgi:hypothetical protein
MLVTGRTQNKKFLITDFPTSDFLDYRQNEEYQLLHTLPAQNSSW